VRVLGLNPLKGCVCFAEADGPPFSVVDRGRLMFDGDAASGLVTLSDDIKVLLESARSQPIDKIVICGRSTFSSSPEAIKGEGICELVACKLGIAIETVSPQRLKKVLGGDGKWQDLVARKLNPAKSEKYWAQGIDGAFAAAFSGFAP
jgi:hypothetical protein